MGCAMSQEHTTAAVQRYLDELAGDSPADLALWDEVAKVLQRAGA